MEKTTKTTLQQILEKHPDKYPRHLEERFARILNRISEFWGTQQLNDYFHDLLVDYRGNRQGFPPEVASEILALSLLHEVEPQKEDVWSHVTAQAKQELESLGYAFTPKGFFKSVSSGNVRAAVVFLSAGVDVDIRDGREWTPLMWSAFHGSEAMALLLLNKGANPKARDKGGYTPLHWAALNGYAGVVRLLIHKGADVNARSHYGITPLLQAAARGQTLVAQLLLKAGADPNQTSDDGWTPLHKAVANDHAETVKVLVSSGADVHSRYHNGTTPLAAALKKKNMALVSALRQAGGGDEDENQVNHPGKSVP
jgi:ankyrin repeat protein